MSKETVSTSLAPYVSSLCGDGYRLDHQPMVLLQDAGSEGFSLHGGPMVSDEAFNPALQYRCVAGRPWNSLVAMACHLVDAPAGAGARGFAARAAVEECMAPRYASPRPRRDSSPTTFPPGVAGAAPVSGRRRE